MRVAAGAIARKYLAERLGVRIHAWVSQLGPIELAAPAPETVDDNPFFCADPGRVPELEAFMDRLRKSGDSVGARVEVVARGVPPGLGEPVFDKLDADIAHGMMGINAVKGQDIRVSDAFKPTSSLRLPCDGVDVHGQPVTVVTTGRHDPCVGLRGTPIAEAMLALVLMDHYLRHRAQNGDVSLEQPPIPG